MRSTPGGPPLQLQLARVRPLGEALGALSAEVYVAIDRAEPEWPVLERLAPVESPAGLLAALALALSDFQLGAGGARLYWHETQAALDEQGIPRTTHDVGRLMAQVLSRPVCARLRTMKQDRVDRLIRSPLPDRLAGQTLAELGEQPMALWHDLAMAMGQKPDAKTIVFAMKVFDLLYHIATSRYVAFPAQVPIVSDLRIARVSFSGGLLAPPPGHTVAEAMTHSGECASSHTGEIIDAWAQVSEETSGLSLFRIDSLLWQVAEPIYQHREDRRRAAAAVCTSVESYAADSVAAARLADELTWALSATP